MNRNLIACFRRLPIALVLALVVAAPAGAAENKQAKTSAARSQNHAGLKQKIEGVIVKRDADGLRLQDRRGFQILVSLTDATKVEEKKANPFRRARNYATTELMRGLHVEVEGRQPASGMLVAQKIRFSDSDLLVARTVESQVLPVESRVSAAESRVGEAETRLSSQEENAQRLSGQIDELGAVSNAARGGAKAAQETADAAVVGVGKTNQRITQLVSGLDEYDAKQAATIRFKVSSAVLSDDAKATLDEIAAQAKAEKAFLIEVAGFASSDGDPDFNRRLSQHRADAVVGYLTEKHTIPLRRIVTPFGYGESRPVADNGSRSGREQNRRVEVKVLVNRGMTTTASNIMHVPESAGFSAPNNLHGDPGRDNRDAAREAQALR